MQGILKMDLVEGEARTLLKMLQYEGQLECYTDPYKEEVFVLAPEQGLNLESRYTEVPCGVCPVRPPPGPIVIIRTLSTPPPLPILPGWRSPYRTYIKISNFLGCLCLWGSPGGYPTGCTVQRTGSIRIFSPLIDSLSPPPLFPLKEGLRTPNRLDGGRIDCFSREVSFQVGFVGHSRFAMRRPSDSPLEFCPD